MNEIEQMAVGGSDRAKSFIDEYAQRLIRGTASIANAVAIDCIIFYGGGIGKSDIFWNDLNRYFYGGDFIGKEEGAQINIIREIDLSVARGALRFAMLSAK